MGFASARARHLYVFSCAFAGGLIFCAQSAIAQTQPIETVVVTGEVQATTAIEIVPTSTPLDAIQPTSIISSDFIQKNLPLSTNYDEAIKYSPSVFDVAPNGTGLAESQAISIRGFQDGFFNVTFDGIPFQDSNDFTHHTTSYFASHDFAQISVDRGPGTAATIGDATFGGTVSTLSKAPADLLGVTAYGGYGSWDTGQYGLEFDSGPIEDTDGTRLFLDAEGLQSNGYLTNEGLNRKNMFLKLVQPLGANTTLAVVGMVNHIHQNISLGATAAQIATLGPNWGLSRDPTNQNFFGYNLDKITTDFEYTDLASHFGDGWTFDGKVYTYAYFHQGFNGEDPNGGDAHAGPAGGFPNGTCVGTTPPTDPHCAPPSTGVFFANDVPGQKLQNDYRSIGTIIRLTKEFFFGDVKAGVWYDHQFDIRSLFEVDMSQNLAPNTNCNTGAQYTDAAGNQRCGIDRDLTQNLQSLQPYVQVDWNVLDNLTLSPGVRYSWFDRNVNAIVNVKTAAPQTYDNKYEAFLPSVIAHYAIQPNWTAYAQAAEGFLAPNENFFTIGNTAKFSPERTWNYQVGTQIQLPYLAASADAYYIDFNNFIHCMVVGANEDCTNLGGITFTGLEGDVTYKVGHGVSLYANGSLNSAKLKGGGGWAPDSPQSTFAVGGIYDDYGFYASIVGKFVGPRIGDVTPDFPHGLPPVFTVDAALDYNLSNLTDVVRDTWIRLEVQNLTDETKIINNPGTTVFSGQSLYWTEPGRSFFIGVTTTFP